GHIVRLGFDDGQRGQRARAVFIVQLRGTFQKARVQIEHVARIGLAARRTAKQQRHLAICDSLLGQVVINDDRMHAVVAEKFAHGAAGKRCDVLHRCGLRGSRRDHDRVFERALLFQHLDELRHRGALLADRDIDAIELDLLVARCVQRLLVQNRVERDRGFARLSVANDQLALAATDGDERVNRLQTGRHRLAHRFARNDAGRLHVDAAALAGLDRTLAVYRITEGVNHATEQALADRRINDGARTLYGLTFLDLTVGTEDHDADVVGFEIERHAAGAVLELHHLAGLNVVQPVDARDAVANGKHLPDFGHLGFLPEVFDLILEDRGNFRGADVHQPASFIACLIELSLVRSELSTMRLPSLTTRPPMSERSTFTLRITSLPVTDFSEALSASRFLSESASATVTSAVASPLNFATSALNARITSLMANSRRLTVRTFKKLAETPVMPALSSIADNAFNCASAANTGLRTRRLRSALCSSIAANASRSALTASIALSSRANSNKAVAYRPDTPDTDGS